MYTFLDFENKVFIPQNKNTFFTINKSNNYNYAVEIKINLKEDISILNLFLLLKSYINDNVFLTTSIGCIFKEKDGKRFITDNLSLRYFNKMNQFDFEEWIIFRIQKDWKYNKEEDFYSIVIFFEKRIIELENEKNNTDCLAYLKPIFPWKNEILKYIKKSEKNVIIIEHQNEEIEKLKKEIEKLKKENMILKKINQ